MKCKVLFVFILSLSALLAQDWNEIIKIGANDKAVEDNFGYSVAISGDYAVVGAHRKDVGFDQDLGAAYVFVRNGSTWALQQKLVASDAAVDDRFGSSVAISGDYLIVGSPQDSEDANGENTLLVSGSAYIFVRDGSTWVQQQKIVPSDRTAYTYFGESVSISGDYAIVGSKYDDLDANGTNALQSAGSAYIFQRLNSIWIEYQKLSASDRLQDDNFGSSVAISGNYAIVGATGRDLDVNGENYVLGSGAAYIYEHNANSWNLLEKLNASVRGEWDSFGASVAISADYAIVGAFNEDEDLNGENTLSDAGSAYIYARSNSNWGFTQKIVAPDREAYAYFGYSVAISGNYALIGAYNEDKDTSASNILANAGAAYMYERGKGNWILNKKLLASDRGGDDHFGWSVAMSGDYAIMGAFGEDRGVTSYDKANCGAAYIFKKESVIPPIATQELYNVKEDSLVSIVLKATDLDSEELTFSVLDSTSHGILTGSSEDLTYIPESNYFGFDSLAFTVSDGSLLDTGKIFINVQAINDRPIAIQSNYTINEDSVLIIILEGEDMDGDVLTFTLLDSTVNGRLTGIAPQLLYVPDANFYGFDSLKFIVDDGELRDTASCNITILAVNDAPVWASLPDTSFYEDDSLIISLALLLTYLSDSDQQLMDIDLSFYVPDVFHYGMLGDMLYLTAQENWFGEESILINAFDGTDSSTVAWHLSVIPVNDAPVFTSFIDSTVYLDLDMRDTIMYSELFSDIDTPDSMMNIVIEATKVKYEIMPSEAMLILFTKENISLNETIRIILNDGDNEVYADLSVQINEVSIEIIPQDFALYSPYPNPFNPITTIAYDIPHQADVKMIIYDINGKKVRTLVNEAQEPQSYRIMWDGLDNNGSQVSSGMYICRITAKSSGSIFNSNQKLLLVK